MLKGALHIILLTIVSTYCLVGQTPQDQSPDAVAVKIGSIYIAGNQKTREEIILRELSFEKGDVLKKAELLNNLDLDRQKLMNTRLFVTVDIVPLMMSEDEADILIRLQERWYIFPVPIFRLADRNFTEWWVNQKRDFSRVNWGAQLFHMNLSGRNDRLNARIQFGFTQQFGIGYSLPYIDKKQKLGISFNANYATNKTIGLTSDGHRQVFLDSEEVLRESFGTNFSLIHRPSFYDVHTFDIGYNQLIVQDTVAQLNPNYLGNGLTRQRFFRLSYVFTHDRRDFISYPLKGTYFRFTGNQFGLGIFDEINLLSTRASYGKYFDLGKDFFQANRFEVFKNWGEEIPYVRRSGFGYNPDFVRGYERYVIETDFLISYRTELKWEFLEGITKLNERSIVPQFRTLPYAFYLKVFADLGYAGDPLLNTENNFWNNDLIGSIGLGLDVVTYYDFVMRLEYSINRSGQTGFYFNFRTTL